MTKSRISASSRVSNLTIDSPARLILEIDVGELFTREAAPQQTRLEHIRQQYATRLRLFRGGMAMAISEKSTVSKPLVILIAVSVLTWAVGMAIHGF